MTAPFRSCLLAGLLTLPAWLPGLAPAARAQAGFAAATTYPMGGTTPLGLAVADLNGDGRPDVVTGNQGSDNVSVLLGQASPAGSLGAAVVYSMGAGARTTGVAVADLNGDNRPDIVAANQTSATVAVLLNSATAPGTFGPATTYSTVGAAPNFPLLVDLNGDGRRDIAVGNTGGGTVAVLLASVTAPGTFAPAVLYSFAGALGLASADVNRDGQPDLVVANSGGGVGVLLNSATAPGTFGPATTYLTGGGYAVGVALGDVNGDGYLDLAVSNLSSANLSVLPGTATGTFGAATRYPTGGMQPNLVVLADVNGDGRLDLATGNQAGGTAAVLLGQATPAGTFAAAVTYATGPGTPGPVGVAVADMDGDARLDLVLTNATSNSVAVLRNTYALATAPALAGAEVSLYPNPARGTFTVQLPASAAPAVVQTELLDALGRVVRRAALHSTPDARLAFDAAGLPAGCYILRLQAPTWQFTRQVAME